MFMRFQGAVLLAVLVAIGGSSVEDVVLDRHRSIGRQHYRLDILQERVARLRLRTEELGSPSRLVRPVQGKALRATAATGGSAEEHRPGPLLRWRATAERTR